MHKVLLLNSSVFLKLTSFSRSQSLLSGSSGFPLLTLVTGCGAVPGGEKDRTSNGRAWVQSVLPFTGHHSCPCKNSPVMHRAHRCWRKRWAFPRNSTCQVVNIILRGQAVRNCPPLSLMPRKRINDPCKDQNRNGTSKYQSSSFLYYPDLYFSTDQVCFWKFPEVLAKSTKILTPSCTVNVMCSYLPPSPCSWKALFAPLLGVVNTPTPCPPPTSWQTQHYCTASPSRKKYSHLQPPHMHSNLPWPLLQGPGLSSYWRREHLRSIQDRQPEVDVSSHGYSVERLEIFGP